MVIAGMRDARTRSQQVADLGEESDGADGGSGEGRCVGPGEAVSSLTIVVCARSSGLSDRLLCGHGGALRDGVWSNKWWSDGVPGDWDGVLGGWDGVPSEWDGVPGELDGVSCISCDTPRLVATSLLNSSTMTVSEPTCSRTLASSFSVPACSLLTRNSSSSTCCKCSTYVMAGLSPSVVVSGSGDETLGVPWARLGSHVGGSMYTSV